MKKGLLFLFVVLLTTTTMTAQMQKPARNSLSNAKDIKSLVYRANHSLTKTKDFAVASESDKNTGAIKIMNAPQAGISYSKPAGTYHVTLSYVYDEDTQTGGYGLYNPSIAGKANYDWKFVPTGGSTYTWAVNGNPMNADANGNGIYNEPTGTWYLPTVTSGSSTYIWHPEATNRFATASSDLFPMSMVDVWSGSTGQYWGDMVSGFGNYVYGTEFATQYGTSVGFYQQYDQPQAPLYIESVNVIVFSNNNAPLPGGSKMLCSIVPMTGTGFPDLANPIATSECTADDLEDLGTGFSDGTEWFNAPFHFYEQDPVSGYFSPMDLVVSQTFAIVIQWTDGADFACLFGASDTDGSKSRVFDDAGYYYNYYVSSPTQYRIDLLVNINGVMPELSLDQDIVSVQFDPAGGESKVTYTGANPGVFRNAILESTFSADAGDVTIDETPDWVTVTSFQDELNSDNSFANYIDVVLNADPLPTGLNGRSGDITVNSHGVSTSFHVTQGDATGIPSIKAELATVSSNGDNFTLKYPASATSVAIYNVTGQRLASYQLPTSGTFSVPAGNYSKGAYLFTFTGANGASTVKVLK